MLVPCGRLQNSRLDTPNVSNINTCDSGRAFFKQTEILCTFVIKKSYCGLQYTVMFCKWNISASKTAIVPWQTSAGFICSLKPLPWKKCAVSCFIWNTQGNKNRRQGHVISSQRWYRWRRFSFGENNSTTWMFFIFFSPYPSRWNSKREKQFLSFSILILQMKDFAQLKSSFDCMSKEKILHCIQDFKCFHF